jgi:hypothetical protein
MVRFLILQKAGFIRCMHDGGMMITTCLVSLLVVLLASRSEALTARATNVSLDTGRYE